MTHRRSKISRLPEPIQTRINELLDANDEYSHILKWLKQEGYPDFRPYHLTRWRYSGYLDWLQEQEQEHQLDRKLRWAEKQAASGVNSTLHKAAMSAIALKLYDAINRAESCDLSMMLHDKPEKIATLINSFARYSREVLAQDRFQEDLRRRAMPSTAPNDPCLNRKKLRNPNRKRTRNCASLHLIALSCSKTHQNKKNPPNATAAKILAQHLEPPASTVS